ncbi:MAG: DNA methyltransferase [Elusimicrobiota bacterium]
MKGDIFQVEDLPEEIEFNSIIEITTNNVNYFTHGFFKYPCKFIPQIPRWAILKYTKEKQLVLDPFAGSGTTLVEAVINNRNALGVDFDKLSQLLCKTKTSLLDDNQIQYLYKLKNNLFENINNTSDFKPDIHNVNHWFPEYNIQNLSKLKEKISNIYKLKRDEKIHNLLLTCFASIIKKCSYADNTSPKPYVSTRFKKEPLKVKESFLKTLELYLKRMEEYKNRRSIGKAFIISEDARQINTPEYEKNVSLAVTSPPYINAFDYVRSLRLENAWLGFYGDSNVKEMKKIQVGTETIPSNIYKKKLRKHENKKLNSILEGIYERDKKRAFVVLKFFEDMDRNFKEVYKLLKEKAHYVIVVGDSKIKGIDVPTHEILIDIAKRRGYRLENIFSYIIKNRYLRIPRSGRGGLIKRDWVIDLVKENG